MSIPAGLPPQFVNYLLVPKADGADKIPCDAVGRAIDHLDPRNWRTHEEAVAAGRPVAFVLTDACGWFFLDLDKCRDENGWSAAATALFTRFTGAWGEVSSSGRGLHVMGRCNPATLADRKRRWDGWLECYTGGRFIAFGDTGWSRIGGHEVDYDWTNVLLEVVPQRALMGDLPTGVDPSYTGPEDDEGLIARAMLSGGAGAQFGLRASFKDLWTGDVVALSRIYPNANGGFDHSSADAALLAHLAFWTGKDMPRMDRLFRRSALMRDKYATRPDYRDKSIGDAVRLCTKVYDKPRAVTASAAPGPHEAYLTLAEMQDHFKGCVYIRDVHRIMIPGGAMLKPEQFNASYGGHQFQMQADGTKPSTKAFEAFTENRAMAFPKANRPIFNPRLQPGEIIDDGVNIYFPSDVVMTPGDVSPLMGLLAKLLPDARDRAILINYMAACVQYPGVKFQWAPVLQGCEGNGKTLVFSCIRYAVGQKFTHSPKADQLGNQFNSYLEGKLFVLVEEVHMRGRGEMLDVLKPLITNEEIEIEGKGSDKRMIQNFANWGFCTNFHDAILKSRGDRRYSVFFTAQQRVEDLARDGMTGEYFPALWSWLKSNGGYAAVAHWLKNFQIDPALNPAGLCHRAPQTSSTEAAIAAAAGSVEKDILEACEDNTRGFRGGWISAWSLDKLMRDRHVKISRFRQSEIVRELGFVEWGRAPRAMIEEDGKRPMIYIKAGLTGTFEQFLTAQSYM